MNLLDSLPTLPDITGNHSYPASTAPSSGGKESTASTVGKIMLGINPATNKFGNFSVQSIVFIVLGLLFIAAGIFAFREVRQTVVTTAKTAVKAAAVA